MATAFETNRLAFCITDLDPGGAERAMLQLVLGLQGHEWSPAVFCLAGRGVLADELESAGIPVRCYGARGWKATLPVVRRLTRDLRAFRPVLLQTFLFHANLVGRVAGRRAGVPRIVSGIRVAERRSRLRLWLDRASDRLVDRHVCVSRGVAEFSVTRGGLPTHKVLVIPNGVDAERFSRAAPADLGEFGIPPGSRTLLFVGRLDPQKRPELFLAAAEPLLRAPDDVHALLLGEGPLRLPLERQIEAQQLSGRVHLAGRRDDVPALMKAASCLVLTSAWEGMPNVVLEAMAAGLPVVTTQVEGIEELAESGTILTVPASGDFHGVATQISEAIRSIMDDSEAAERLSALSQDVVSARFTNSQVVAAYDDLYRSLIADLRGSGVANGVKSVSPGGSEKI